MIETTTVDRYWEHSDRDLQKLIVTGNVYHTGKGTDDLYWERCDRDHP